MAFAKSNLTVYEVEGLPILAINGRLIDSFNEEYGIEGPQSAIIYKGRTLVQLKEVSEGLGFNLKWDSKTKKIELKKGNTSIKLTVGSKKAYLNGKAKTLDVPPMTLAGRTMVPLRFIGGG
ncbi:copper amine oxidase N-terminal domain-containing protein [Patescibacteria group bacterium]|nr:copper amine oxidase N-terminal domain-containing protein [Patescibacteria group bacterium]